MLQGESQARLDKFINTKILTYKERRDLPAGNNTSVLSVHLAAGTLSSRTCVREALRTSASDKVGYRYAKKLEDGKAGAITWIAELAWRDFYRHILAHYPYVV